MCGPGALEAAPGRGGSCPVRRRGRLHGAEFLHRLGRVVAGAGGYLLGDRAYVDDGLHQHRHRLSFVRSLGGGPDRPDDLVRVVHHRPAVIGLLEVPASRTGHYAGLRIGEVALRPVIRHPGMIAALGLSLLRLCQGPGLQRRLGLPYLPQPALPEGQFLRQLVPTLVLAVPAVLVIRLLGPPQQPATFAANRASFSSIRL